MDYSKLTDDEFIISISDTIVHEFMHYLLDREFNAVVSKLFDVIGYLFYTNYNLLLKSIDPDKGGQAWTTRIAANGMQEFLDQYGITPDRFKIAEFICSNRQK